MNFSVPQIIIFIIITIAILSLSLLISLLIKIRKTRNKFLEYVDKNDLRILNSDEFLSDAVSHFDRCVETNNETINTQAIIGKFFYEQKILSFPISFTEKLIRQTGNIAIILGLLGTFIGLILSLKGIRDTLNTLTSDSSIQTIQQFLSTSRDLLQAITIPLNGMWYAFLTSVVGLIVAILMLIFRIVFDIEDEKSLLFTEIEEYLDNVRFFEKKPKNNFALTSEGLQSSVVQSINKFGEEIQKTTESMNEVISNISYTFNQIRGFSSNIESMNESFEKYKNLISISLEKMEEANIQHKEMVQESEDNMQNIILDLTNENKNNISNIKEAILNLSSYFERLDRIYPLLKNIERKIIVKVVKDKKIQNKTNANSISMQSKIENNIENKIESKIKNTVNEIKKSDSDTISEEDLMQKILLANQNDKSTIISDKINNIDKKPESKKVLANNIQNLIQKVGAK